HYSVSGTATEGFDFEPLSGVVTIPSGLFQTDLPVSIIPDTLGEGDETLVVTLEPSGSYALGSPSEAVLTILDDATDTGPSVTIEATDPQADEWTLDPAVFTVRRSGDLLGGVEVHYSVGGTALMGQDYEPLPGSVWLAPGQSSATIVVTPRPDDLA